MKLEIILILSKTKTIWPILGRINLGFCTQLFYSNGGKHLTYVTQVCVGWIVVSPWVYMIYFYIFVWERGRESERSLDIVYKTRHCQDIVANSRMFELYLMVLPVKCYQGVQKLLRCSTNWILLVILREGLMIYKIYSSKKWELFYIF